MDLKDQEPKVFYGPRRSRSPPDQRRRGSGSGSEAETETEEPRRFKRLHRRLASEATHNDSASETRKRAKVGRPLRRDMYGRAPLQRACERNNMEQVKALVAEGVDVNDRDFGGTTALHGAALQGDPDVVKHLLDNGAIVDVRSGQDELDTPLMDAASCGHIEAVELLLQRGADPRIVNRAGKTAIDFSNDNEDDDDSGRIVELLRAAIKTKTGPIPNEETSVAGTFPPKKKEPVVKDASESPEDTSYDYGRRYTRQEYVQRAGRGDIVFLGTAIEHGWRPNAESLIQAAKFGHADVVGLMLAFGSSADEKHDGVTSLHETLGKGHPGVVELLIENGANLYWRDSQGRSYLDLVAKLPEDNKERALIETAIKNQPAKKPRSKSRSEPRKRDSNPDLKHERSERPDKSERTDKSERPDKHEKKRVPTPDPKEHRRDPRTDGPAKTEKKKVKFEKSPHSTPPPPAVPAVPVKSAEELAAERAELAELAARRDRERKEREAQVLAAIDEAARKAAERKERAQSMSEQTVPAEARSVKETAHHSPAATMTPATPDPVAGVASPSTAEGSPAPVTPDPPASVPREVISSLPLALRELAQSGAPQPTARPLMVLHKAAGDQVLDVQVALALGQPRLHRENPDLTKQAATHAELQAFWGVAGVWVAPGTVPGEADAERAKFEQLRPNWLLLSEVRKIPGAETLPVVPVSLKPVVPRVELAWNRLQELPLRLAVKLSERAAESQWGRFL